MRLRKTRGYNRKVKEIEQWANQDTLLNKEFLAQYGRDYVKFEVYPWNSLKCWDKKSWYAEPTGNAKKLLVEALVTIYNHWKIQLDKLGQPYYLKIWLYEPQISKSQVVCAIGDKIEYYNALFKKQDNIAKAAKGPVTKGLDNFIWDLYFDEDVIEADLVGKPDDYSSINNYYETLRWFNKKLKKPHRVERYTTPYSWEAYCFVIGNLWVGESR